MFFDFVSRVVIHYDTIQVSATYTYSFRFIQRARLIRLRFIVVNTTNAHVQY